MGKHGTVSLHGEECDITSRSRVDRDGGKTHMCQKDLEQSTPCGRGNLQGVQHSEEQDLHVLSLGRTGKNGF